MIASTTRTEILRQLAASPNGATVTIAGRSMEPTLLLGAQITVRATSRIAIGDVALFETAARDALMLHRIIAIAPGRHWFAHLGDAGSPLGPRWARTEMIIGIAAANRIAPRLRDRARAWAGPALRRLHSRRETS